MNHLANQLAGFAARTRGREQPYSLARLLAALASPFGADESVPEWASSLPQLQALGRAIDGRSAIVPWAALGAQRRDLDTATPGAGGNVAGQTYVTIAPALSKYSVMADAGATVEHMADGVLSVATFMAPLVAQWVAEGSAASESDPVFGNATGSPKVLVTPPVDVSRKMLKQTANLDSALREHIGLAIGKALDAAALNGSGAANNPTGALVVSGTTAQSGTSLGRAGLVAMAKAVLAAGARQERLRWFVDAGAFETLAVRESDAGSGYLIENFAALGIPLHVAEGMPSNSLLLMDAADVIIALWGPGVEIRVNPYAGGTTGAVRFDCQVLADVVLPHAGRIAKSTSIT